MSQYVGHVHVLVRTNVCVRSEKERAPWKCTELWNYVRLLQLTASLLGLFTLPSGWCVDGARRQQFTFSLNRTIYLKIVRCERQHHLLLIHLWELGERIHVVFTVLNFHTFTFRLEVGRIFAYFDGFRSVYCQEGNCLETENTKWFNATLWISPLSREKRYRSILVAHVFDMLHVVDASLCRQLAEL